jgi:hypothetical protein
LLVFALVLGCGKSTQEAESAADESAEMDAPADESAPASADEPEERDDGVKERGKLKSVSGGPTPDAQSSNDAQAVLQLVIDDAELDPYLKLGEPGRFPLKMSGSAVPQGLELVKATKPVEMVGAPKDKKDTVLKITSVEIDGKSASVSYRYDVERIRGTAHLKKGPHGWELTRSRIVEHMSAH